MKTKKDGNVQNFTKLTQEGISLIVLVITIIVIIILATAVIVSILGNNPVEEANKAKFESDVDNMQAVFTNTVAKVMAQNQGAVNVEACQINTETKGGSETTGEVAYTVTDAANGANSSGTIIFDKGTNTDTTFYTGKKLPIYAAGETKWHVDEEGNVSLEIAGTFYGNGSIVNLPENAIIKMYEDLAGDEEGATEGKLHIGDYVDYNPIATGITEKTEDNGYVYVSKNSVTGVTDASGELGYSELSTVTEQRFTTQEGLKWRVLGIKGDNILITTEEAIMPDKPVTTKGGTGYFMYGAKSYVNGIKEIVNISKIYGKGDLAESATGMTIEHINKITGVTVTEDTISPSGVELAGTYGSEYSFAAGSEVGWSPEAWIAKKDGDTSPGISGIASGYMYQLSNENLKTANTSSVRYSLIKKSENSTYFLASRSVLAGTGFADFGIGTFDASSNAVFSFTIFFNSKGDLYGYPCGVRPVVTLKSNVIGNLQSTDSNGVSTWHIELDL